MIEKVKNGEAYVMRFRSEGDFERKFKFHDEVKGDLELSENDEVGTYFDYVTKYVLWDDVLDWERDIKDYGKKKRLRV